MATTEKDLEMATVGNETKDEVDDIPTAIPFEIEKGEVKPEATTPPKKSVCRR